MTTRWLPKNRTAGTPEQWEKLEQVLQEEQQTQLRYPRSSPVERPLYLHNWKISTLMSSAAEKRLFVLRRHTPGAMMMFWSDRYCCFLGDAWRSKVAGYFLHTYCLETHAMTFDEVYHLVVTMQNPSNTTHT